MSKHPITLFGLLAVLLPATGQTQPEQAAPERDRHTECRLEMTVARRQPTALSQANSVIRIETVELLDAIRPYVTMSEGCPASETAEVCLFVETTSMEEIDVTKDCDAHVAPRRPGEPAPADITLHQILSLRNPDRLAEFRAGDLGDATYFDLILYAYYMVREDNTGSTAKITHMSDPAGRERIEQRTVRATVALSHNIATLSIVAQPARAMFAFSPCRGATGVTGGGLPATCADGTGNWLGSINASAFGLKVFWSPIIRYPWVGWSAQASTGVLGYVATLSSPDETKPTDTASAGLFSSPLDISASLIDFRIPAPVRIDFGLFAGAALIRQSKTDVYRFAPQLGISLSTPLVDVFGTRFNRRESAIVDHRTLAPVERELMAAIVAADAAREEIEEEDTLTRATEALLPGAEVCKLMATYTEKSTKAQQILDNYPDLRTDHRYEVEALAQWGGEDDPIRRGCAVSKTMNKDLADGTTKVRELEARRSDLTAAAHSAQADLQGLIAGAPSGALPALRTHLQSLDGAVTTAETPTLTVALGALKAAVDTATSSIAAAPMVPATVQADLKKVLEAQDALAAAIHKAGAELDDLQTLIQVAPDADAASEKWPLIQDEVWTKAIEDAVSRVDRGQRACQELVLSLVRAPDLTGLTALKDTSWPFPADPDPNPCDTSTYADLLQAAEASEQRGASAETWAAHKALADAAKAEDHRLAKVSHVVEARRLVRAVAAALAQAVARGDEGADAVALLQDAAKKLAAMDPSKAPPSSTIQGLLDRAEKVLDEPTP